jgi:hypothetical protein
MLPLTPAMGFAALYPSCEKRASQSRGEMSELCRIIRSSKKREQAALEYRPRFKRDVVLSTSNIGFPLEFITEP